MRARSPFFSVVCSLLFCDSSDILSVPVKEAFISDNLENELEKVRVEDGAVYADVSNFEIVTLKLKIAE